MSEADDNGFDARWDGASIPREHWHFHRRLLERYGLVLQPGEYSKIVKKLAKGKWFFIGPVKRGGAVYKVFTRSAPKGFFIVVTGRRPRTAYPLKSAIRLIRRRVTRERAKIRSSDDPSAEMSAETAHPFQERT